MIDFDALVLVPCQETFGWDVTFQPKNGPGFTLSGIFSSDFQAINSGGELVVQGRAPVLGIRQAELREQGAAVPREGDGVTFKHPFTGQCFRFEVASVEPDAEGDLQVHLVKR